MRRFLRVRKGPFDGLLPEGHSSCSILTVQISLSDGTSRPEDWVELVPISTEEIVEIKTVEVKKCVVL